ncbi:hypothetical protein EDB80DRAFT_755462 [Ilyonectria destructans]|nr:hypothetical protein EDB80DRAFT_755462 [Ilyonectria destructans]
MSQPVAVVTGGASGIGLAIVRHLHSNGYRVVIADINATDGQAVASELGPSALFQKLDVSSFTNQKAVFKTAFDWGGNRLDLLAANAGIDDCQLLHDTGIDAESDTEDAGPQPLNMKALDVNLISVFQAIWIFRYYNRRSKSPGGKVVITASAAGLYPMPSLPQYCATKHGLVGLTRSAGPTLLKTDGITVNCICPGFIVTNLCPKHMVDKFPKEHITPMSSVLRAYDAFLTDDSLTGQTVELSLDQLYYRTKPEYANESQRWLGEDSAAFWEEAYAVAPPAKNEA